MSEENKEKAALSVNASIAINFPDEIWVGFFGGGRIWGPKTSETHPDNVIYQRKNLDTNNPNNQNAELLKVAKLAQSLGEMLTDPDRIKNSSAQHAWAKCVELERLASAAIKRAGT